ITIDAIKKAVSVRKEPKFRTDEELLLLTSDRTPWVVGRRNGVSDVFNRLCRKAKIRKLGFLSLRRTFQTIGSETGDEVAVSAIMGHAPRASDMSALYRQRVTDDRLLRVTTHVFAWLFPEERNVTQS